MEKFFINGGVNLDGEVEINGAKNAAVAIIPATLLAGGPCILRNLPNIRDVYVSCQILKKMGVTVRRLSRHVVEIDATTLTEPVVPYDLARKMRASYYFLGALLTKFGEASVAMPGGCNFGVRPINLHIDGFNLLGAEHKIENGMIKLSSRKLVGNRICFDIASVGATINILLAATMADGVTIIENAAREPHIVDLANFLNSIGAHIMGAGTNVIKIKGTSHLSYSDYTIIPDQIEAGTYMTFVAASGGNVLIKNVTPKHLEVITNKMRNMGVNVIEYDSSIRILSNRKLKHVNLITQPYPGFPTDMQPQMTAVLALAEGTSIVTEGVWNNRFKYVGELSRMGADIIVDGKVAVVNGLDSMNGAPVSAPDLRAGAALIVAALSAEGTTEIENIEYIERGYEKIENKLRGIGAEIERSMLDYSCTNVDNVRKLKFNE